MRQGERVTHLLKSLMPTEAEDSSLLRFVIQCAQHNLKGSPTTVAFQTQGAGLNLTDFWSAIPEEAKKYFHGLVEALEIYQSIHGCPFPSQISVADKALLELKRIREMCLEEGPRFVF